MTMNDLFGWVYLLSQNRFKFYTPDIILERKKAHAITSGDTNAMHTHAVLDKGRSAFSHDNSDSSFESESETDAEITKPRKEVIQSVKVAGKSGLRRRR